MRHAQKRNAARREKVKAPQRARIRAERASRSSVGDTKRVRYSIDGKEVDAVGRCMTPPSNFCLEENTEEVLQFLHDFREVRLLDSPRRRRRSTAGGRRWIGVYADIASICRITPAAAVVLASEFDRAERRGKLGRRGIVDANDWDPSVSRTLTDVGFLRHLHAPLPAHQEIGPRAPGRQMLPMLTSNQNVPEDADRLGDNLEELMHSVIHSDVRKGIYEGLIEAMDNCVSHAYPENHDFRYPTEQKRWWMSGSVANGQELEVIFFDQGATIPGTLPYSDIAERARLWLKQVLNRMGFDDADDGQRIRAAMEVGRSMYRGMGRGHGLAQMQRLVDSAASGSLRILSRRGRYIYEKGLKETTDTLGRSISGTLVHWRLRL